MWWWKFVIICLLKFFILWFWKRILLEVGWFNLVSKFIRVDFLLFDLLRIVMCFFWVIEKEIFCIVWIFLVFWMYVFMILWIMMILGGWMFVGVGMLSVEWVFFCLFVFMVWDGFGWKRWIRVIIDLKFKVVDL